MTWSLSARVNGERRRLNHWRRDSALPKPAGRLKTPGGDRADGVDPTAAKAAAKNRRKAAAEGHGTLGSVIAAYFETGPGGTCAAARLHAL